MKKKTFIYSDELNDDFAGNNINQKELPKNYKYFHGFLRTAWAWFFYHVIATPIVTLLQKIFYGDKYIGKEKIKPYKKSGYYLFGNHTRAMGDAYAPTLIAFPKKAYIIVNPDAVSIPIVNRIVEDLGGVPLPTSPTGMKKFCSAINKHVELNHVITIYPEAHIWPFYTKIRPFKETSFYYPIKSGKPVFSFTTTYQKRKITGGVKATVYIDGPFFPDSSLSIKEAEERLRNQVYDKMVERSKNSTYEKNEYIKKA